MERKNLGEDYFSEEGIRRELTEKYGKLGIFTQEQIEQFVDVAYNIRNQYKRELDQIDKRRESSEKQKKLIEQNYLSNLSNKKNKSKISIAKVGKNKFSKLIQEIYNSGQNVNGVFRFSPEYNYGGQDFKYKREISLFNGKKIFKYSDAPFFESQDESVDNLKGLLRYLLGEGSRVNISSNKVSRRGVEGKFEIYHPFIAKKMDLSKYSKDLGQLSLNI